MFRAKISLLVAAVLLVLGGAGFLGGTSPPPQTAKMEMQGRLERGRKLIPQVARLEAYDFAALAAGFAHEEEFLQAMAQPDVTQRRERLFVALEARNARLGKESR